MTKSKNELKTIEDFGKEWRQFNFYNKDNDNNEIFNDYFNIVPKEYLTKTSIVADIGCGSGRWAKFIAPKVKILFLIDASSEAISVSKMNLKKFQNIKYFNNDALNLPFDDTSIDFIYSLGVLHHIHETEEAIEGIYRKLKRNGAMLLYLYYNFENRSLFFNLIWRFSNIGRILISNLPFRMKLYLCNLIAFFIYLPLAKIALLMNYFQILPKNFPLSYYKNKSFYHMKTDSLDRFGTRIEKRYSKKKINDILTKVGFKKIIFSDKAPFWCVIGIK